MKRHHTHKSKSLTPRILAALAAGAFTLGGMPHALADPTVMSTVTTDTVASEGVAAARTARRRPSPSARTAAGHRPRSTISRAATTAPRPS